MTVRQEGRLGFVMFATTTFLGCLRPSQGVTNVLAEYDSSLVDVFGFTSFGTFRVHSLLSACTPNGDLLATIQLR